MLHCVKSVRFRSFSGPYSVRMRENTDQKNAEYGHFSCSAHVPLKSKKMRGKGTLLVDKEFLKVFNSEVA